MSHFEGFPREVSFRVTLDPVILSSETFNSEMSTPKTLSSKTQSFHLELQPREAGCLEHAPESGTRSSGVEWTCARS